MNRALVQRILNQTFFSKVFCWFTTFPKISESSPKILTNHKQKHFLGPVPPCIMCVQYIGGCSVHRGVFSTWGDTMSTSGGYHEYIGGIS